MEKQTNILTWEANLQPSRTFTTDHFFGNSQQLKVVNYFRKTCCIADARRGSKYASIHYMTYLSKTCVSTKKMLAELAHKKY